MTTLTFGEQIEALLTENAELKKQNAKLEKENGWVIEWRRRADANFIRLRDDIKLHPDYEDLMAKLNREKDRATEMELEKEEVELALGKLEDMIEIHPDYEDTIQSTIETAQKDLKSEIEMLKRWRKTERAQYERLSGDIKVHKDYGDLCYKLKKEQQIAIDELKSEIEKLKKHRAYYIKEYEKVVDGLRQMKTIMMNPDLSLVDASHLIE
jgi:chromosome segregation ATPase